MQNNKQVAILLSWPRELDFYRQLIDGIEDQIVFLIDDMRYSERERSGNSKNIELMLLKHELPYDWLSRTICKYPILVSTGLSYDEVINVRTTLKFIYGRVVGSFIEFFGADRVFKKIFDRPFTAGGKSAVRYKMCQIERRFGYYTIRFPKGLDVSEKTYPEERWRNAFDIHLCHGNIDKALIEQKFQGADCRIIGYPKYSTFTGLGRSKERIQKEFSIKNNSKPLILWMPTHIKIENEMSKNLLLWIPFLRSLVEKNNVVVRPHPKSLIVSPSITELLKKEGFLVDSKPDRNLITLYNSADLVIADYGSSVCSACFIGKPVLLLNLPQHLEYSKMIKEGDYVDGKMRDYLLSINLDQGHKISKFVFEALSKNDSNKTIKVQNYLFGEQKERLSKKEVQNLFLAKTSTFGS